MNRLEKQLQFIVEIDKVKSVLRRTKIFHGNRHENDAEHSWHIALMALVLNEYSNEKVDLFKVLKMVLIHDLVEIHAGDLSVYDTNPQEKQKSELEAAQKIFDVLPNDQNQEFLSLWKGFEKRETPEAKFASALDRLEPVMQNCLQDGYTWKKYKISYEQIINLNKRIDAGSNKLWKYAKGIIDECKTKKII
jgi:putative hydrolase of HD superfamily